MVAVELEGVATDRAVLVSVSECHGSVSTTKILDSRDPTIQTNVVTNPDL